MPHFWARKYCSHHFCQITLSVMTIRKIRQIESANLKKTDRTIAQAHTGPKWPTFEVGNINSAISSALVRYHYHCPILSRKWNSWKRRKSCSPSLPRKKYSPPTFPWNGKKKHFACFVFLEKSHRPFFDEKKSTPPFIAEKARRPLFFAEKKSPPPTLA